MPFRFENLATWKLARVFTNDCYRITKKFPKEEIFGLTNQLRRAAISIVSNIAEGSDRKSDVEFVRYLRISLTSLNEVVTRLYIATDQQLIGAEAFGALYQSANQLASKLNALINSLAPRHPNHHTVVRSQ